MKLISLAWGDVHRGHVGNPVHFVMESGERMTAGATSLSFGVYTKSRGFVNAGSPLSPHAEVQRLKVHVQDFSPVPAPIPNIPRNKSKDVKRRRSKGELSA